MGFVRRPLALACLALGSILVLPLLAPVPASAESVNDLVRAAFRLQREANGGEEQPEIAAAIDRLWRLRNDETLSERDRRQAGGAALDLLYRGRGLAAVEERLAALEPSDGVWQQAFYLLLRAQAWDRLERAATRVRAEGGRDDLSQHALYVQAKAAARQGDAAASRGWLEQLMREHPDSRLATAAAGDLHEMAHVVVGKPVPSFRAVDLEDRAVSLAGLRGKVVLVDFWATY